LLGKVTGTVRRVQDLVVENGEVEGQAETNGMSWGELSLCNIGGILDKRIISRVSEQVEIGTNLVSLVSSSCSNLALLPGGKLSQITVIVALPVRELMLVISQLTRAKQKHAISDKTYILW
jgi:hypothetical protein